MTDLPEISDEMVEAFARGFNACPSDDTGRHPMCCTRAGLAAALVASGWRPEADVPEHLLGDGPCADCGTVNNIVWFTDSVFWNAVVRQGDYQEPILCIPCFAKRVDAAGYVAAWRLTPEFHWETHEERAARKERWPDSGPPPVRCRLCPGLPYYAAEDYQGHVLSAHTDRATALEPVGALPVADGSPLGAVVHEQTGLKGTPKAGQERSEEQRHG